MEIEEWILNQEVSNSLLKINLKYLIVEKIDLWFILWRLLYSLVYFVKTPLELLFKALPMII
jgi:hypothetical protein